jgi:hypothetical protein
MFNVYKNQLSRQTGSSNLTGPKMLPTIWYTYMLVISSLHLFFFFQFCKVDKDGNTMQGCNDCSFDYDGNLWVTAPAGCHQQLLRKTRQKISWMDGRTEVKQYTPLPLRGAGV